MRFACFGVIALVASSFVAGCDPDPFTVVVSVRDADIVAYRDGDGEWKPVEVPDSGRAQLRITGGRYSLAWVCHEDFFTQSYVLHSTLDDEPRAHCFGGSGVGVSLTGSTVPGTTVYSGASQSVANDLGNYSLFVSPRGYHDVVLVTSEREPRVIIERDVDLRTDRQLDVVFDSRAVAMETVQPLIYGSPQEVSLTSELYTTNGDHVVLQQGGEIMPVVPANMLLETDWQVVRAQGTSCNNLVRVRGETPTLELPEPPIETIARTGLSWSSDVEWSRVRLDLSGSGAQYSIMATRDWIEAAGADGVEIPELARLPGWSSSFGTVGSLGSYSLMFERGSRASSYSSCAVTSDSLF